MPPSVSGKWMVGLLKGAEEGLAIGGGGRGDLGAEAPPVGLTLFFWVPPGSGGGIGGALGAEAEEALGLPGGKAGGTVSPARGTLGLAGGEGAMRGGGGGGIGLCGELLDLERPCGASEAWVLGGTPKATGGGGAAGGVGEEGLGKARPGTGGTLKPLGNVLWWTVDLITDGALGGAIGGALGGALGGVLGNDGAFTRC